MSTDTWTMVTGERRDLADMLETLSDGQWNEPTLCDQWRVRDVVGHIIGTVEIKITPRLMLAMARHRFNVNAYIAADGIARGKASPKELIASLRAMAGVRKMPPGVKRPEGMLFDVVVHSRDIGRPLGIERTIPEARLRSVLDEIKTYKSAAVNVASAIAGLKLVATDIEWTHGDGPEVTGPGEALMMAMAGRTAAVEDLSGEGKERLAAAR